MNETIKCRDCQGYHDYYKSCGPKKQKVNPDEDRTCELCKPIVSREMWIARQEWGALSIFLAKPHYDSKWGRENWTTKADAPCFPDGGRSMAIPSYLYPEVTFKNSPQKLSPK